MQLNRLFDDETLFQVVKADLARRFLRTMVDGRPSMPVEVILRMLIVKYLYRYRCGVLHRRVDHSPRMLGDTNHC